MFIFVHLCSLCDRYLWEQTYIPLESVLFPTCQAGAFLVFQPFVLLLLEALLQSHLLQLLCRFWASWWVLSFCVYQENQGICITLSHADVGTWRLNNFLEYSASMELFSWLCTDSLPSFLLKHRLGDCYPVRFFSKFREDSLQLFFSMSWMSLSYLSSCVPKFLQTSFCKQLLFFLRPHHTPWSTNCVSLHVIVEQSCLEYYSVLLVDHYFGLYLFPVTNLFSCSWKITFPFFNFSISNLGILDFCFTSLFFSW